MTDRAQPRLDGVTTVVGRVGLLTDSAVHTLVATGRHPDLRSELADAIDRGDVFRHRAAHGRRMITYFSQSPHPFRDSAFRARLLVCTYLFLGRSHRTLLSQQTLRDTLESVPGAWDSWGADLPACFISRTASDAPAMLAVVLSGGSKGLQAAVSELDHFAASRRCVPLWHFAERQALCLHYLLEAARGKCLELERWLSHRPPLATCGRPALEIPVRVIWADTLSGLSGG